MKATTSRARFDEQRRFTAVMQQMGRVHLDSDTNEQNLLVRTDARRRSGDVAEGSPDDGFRATDTHLLDPILELRGWQAEGLEAGDERVIPLELDLHRRDPDTLPHVVRTRGATALWKVLREPIDLDALPVPGGAPGATYAASAVVLTVRFARPPTDDEEVEIRVAFLDEDGVLQAVGAELHVSPDDTDWRRVRISRAQLAAAVAPTATPEGDRLVIYGWGLVGLPPRAEVFVDALTAVDPALGSDFVLRGGDGSVAGAGRIFLSGLRAFIESDWRYSTQPDLPAPPALSSPTDPDSTWHFAWLDVWETAVAQFQDDFLVEPALDGQDTTWRIRKLTQVRVAEVDDPAEEQLPTPTGAGLLTTRVPAGLLPDRYPTETWDACRDRCLYDVNRSVGEGYRGSVNAHVRVEILVGGGISGPGLSGAGRPVIGWSRDNGATVAPILQDVASGASTVIVEPAEAARFRAGDVVSIEDRHSRLDPDGPRPHVLREIQAVDTATGIIQLHDQPRIAATDPTDLDLGGPLPRGFRVADTPAIRRWDGMDWLVLDQRYNLVDGIAFRFGGDDFRTAEYWTFTARVDHPDGEARGFVERLEREPVHGPVHHRVPLARIRYDGGTRRFEDLRVRFLPLHDVRDRLIELGRRNLSPGAFTVVVGDGVRTFGDVDQDLEEGVTGDEALQAALDRLGPDGGTIYIRAGSYQLEHTVLIQGRSDVRILGDGDASQLRVVGAGGAFFVDWCGRDGAVGIELLDLVEDPGAEALIGAEALVADLEASLTGSLSAAGASAEEVALGLDDLASSSPTIDDLVAVMGAKIAAGSGRASASVVKTLLALRKLQREHPGDTLEDVAPELLEVLRSLPHGVVTVADSENITLDRLTLRTREVAAEGTDTDEAGASNASGVFITGSCARVAVTRCLVRGPRGLVAAPYSASLSAKAIAERPGSGLNLAGLRIEANRVIAQGPATVGIQIDEGVLRGIRVLENTVEGFPTGIVLSDRAEVPSGQPTERTEVRANTVRGASRLGILVATDGADLISNEVRLEGGEDAVQACVQVEAFSVRVRDSWLVLPATEGAPLTGVRAGVLLGSGLGRGQGGGDQTLTRCVHDVEVSENRIEGQGEDTDGSGVLIAGPGHAHDLRVRDNVIRNLGDAGVRATGHGGVRAELRVEGNRIESVASRYLGWSSGVVAEVATLAGSRGSVLDGADSPSVALEALLAESSDDVLPALEALLTWLERASLRGGVVLSGAEEAVVRGNRVDGVGATALPGGYRRPGSQARTAGMLIVGGRAVTVEDNEILGVFAAVSRELQGAGGEDRDELPILDALVTWRLEASVQLETPQQVHEALAGAWRLALDQVQEGPAAALKARSAVLAAAEAVHNVLAEQGEVGQQLARPIAKGAELVRAASDEEGIAQASTVLRSALAEAAARTAEEQVSARAWTLIGRGEDAWLEGAEAVVSYGEQVAKSAEELVAELDLDLRLPELARKLASSAEESVRLALLDELGRVAAARSSQAAGATASLDGDTRTVVQGLLELVARHLELLSSEGEAADAERLAQLDKAISLLVDALGEPAPTLAKALHSDYAAVSEAALTGTVDTEALASLKETLDQVEVLTRTGSLGTDEQGVERQLDAETQALLRLSTDRVADQLEALSSGKEEGLVRELLGIGATLEQVAQLVASEPAWKERVALASKHVAVAIEDEDRRAESVLTAAQALTEGLDAVDGTVSVHTSEAEPRWRRLAGCAQLVLELEDSEGAEEREDGLDVLDGHLAVIVDELGGSAYLREATSSAVDKARSVLLLGAGATSSASAWSSLARLVDELSRRSARAEDAGGKDLATAALASVGALSVDPAVSEAALSSELGTRLKRFDGALSKTVVRSLEQAGSKAGLQAASLSALTTLTRVGLGTEPEEQTTTEAIAPHPAEGVLCAATTGSAAVRSNRIAQVTAGVSVEDDGASPLAPLDGEEGLSLSIDRNIVVGGILAGLSVTPGVSAEVAIEGNQLSGCAGAADASAPAAGQAVLRVEGEGLLRVVDNRLHDNGHSGSKALLHEVFVSWRGDASVRGNLVRHAGRGGGLVLLGEDLDSKVLRSLCTEAALDVDEAPEVSVSDSGSSSGLDYGSLLDPGFSAAGLFQGATQSVSMGGFAAVSRTATPSYATLEAAPLGAPKTAKAESLAAQWARPRAPQLALPLLDWLVAVPLIPPFVWLPRAHRRWEIAHNDVTSTGPALLLLTDGGPLLACSVVGNQLESSGDDGAVYLRSVDTTVVSGNRAVCREAVNVLVIKAGQALVSVTGNTVVGAEPAEPPQAPVRPKPLPGFDKGELQLLVPLDTGAAVSMRLDPALLLAAMQDSDSKDKGFAVAEAQKAYVTYTADLSWSADLTEAMSTARLALRSEPPDSTAGTTGEAAGGRPRLRSGLRINAAAGTAELGNLSAALSGINAMLGSDLSPTAKLYSAARLTGQDADAAEKILRDSLTWSKGDGDAALSYGLQQLTGVVADTGQARELLGSKGYIEELLGKTILGKGITPDFGTLKPSKPVQPDPPDPRDHSLVVIGGSRVAATGNTTTAGVHIHDASQSIANNL